MIQLLRVDHRLLHGQVAVSWVQGLGSNCIFCVGDKVANDPVWKTTLKMGKPAGCKLVIKDMEHAIEAINSGVTDKYKMIICVATIAEAKQLVEGCPQIKSVNLGNTKPKDEKRPDARQVSRQIFLTAAEEAAQSAAEEEFEADNVDGDVQPMEPDEIIAALRNPEVREILAAANQTMADQLKEETDKLLDSVLYTRSMEMKNGFHMSDF